MAVGDRFKKFDLTKLRTYEKYEEPEASLEVKFSPSAPVGSNFNKNVFVELQNSLLEKIENIPVWFEYSKDKQHNLVESFFDNKIPNYPEYTFSATDRERIINELFNAVSGFGKLDYFLKQDNITKVIVNGYNILIEISGRILNADIKMNDRQIQFLLKNIYHNACINQENKNSIINCKIGNYFINIIDKPLSSKGISLTITKQPQKLGYGELISSKFLTKDVADFLLAVVQGRKNIIITGAQNSGKTFLADNILTASLLSSRTAIIEDVNKISSDSERFSKFSTVSIETETQFLEMLSSISGISPEYILTDIKNSNFVARVLEYALSSDGNIILLPALNTESAMTKAIGLIQNCGYSEKFAKTMFLNSFDYIITVGKTADNRYRIAEISEILQGKTAANTLKQIYNSENNIKVTAEEIMPAFVDNSSFKARFIQN